MYITIMYVFMCVCVFIHIHPVLPFIFTLFSFIFNPVVAKLITLH
jgi:hypothetical protein